MFCNPEEQSGYYNYSAEPYPPCDMSQPPEQFRYPSQSPAFANGPPRSPMFPAAPQAWGNPYGPAGGHPGYYPQTAGYSYINVQVGQSTQKRNEETIRPASIQPNSQPTPAPAVNVPESRPRGRPGRKPSAKAQMPPADISFLHSPEEPRKEKVTRKRRRYETEEEKAASRRERNRLAQERSRMRTKERYDSLHKEMEKMKQNFTEVNGHVLEMLLTMHEHNMPEILASELFKGVIEGLQKLQNMYGAGVEAPMDNDVDSCSEMSD